MKKKPKPDAGQKILEHARTLEEAKALYKRADALLDELCHELLVGQDVELPDGRTARLVDRFAAKSVVWGHCGVRRFEVELSKAPRRVADGAGGVGDK